MTTREILVALILCTTFLAGGVPAGESAAEATSQIEPGLLVVPANRWTKIGDVPPDPLGRELQPGRGAFWRYDPGSGLFFRYGGYTPTDDNSLWTYDLASRTWANPLSVDYSWPPPQDRPGAGAWWCPAYDTKRKVFWLHGGSGLAARTHKELFDDIWRLDPAAWAFAPAKCRDYPRFTAPIIYDAKNDLVVRAPAYGGEWAARHNQQRTWVYNPNTNAWEGRATGTMPPYVGSTVFVYEPNLGKAVYCGHEKDGESLVVWTYDAAANLWERLDIAGEAPPGRVWPGACYDPVNRVVLIYGGAGKKPGGGYGYMHRGGGTVLDDTWALDVARRKWTRLDVGAPERPTLPGQSQWPRFILPIAMDYDTRLNCAVVSAPTFGVWALRYQAGDLKLPELKLGPLKPFDKPREPTEPVYRMAPPNKRLLDMPPGQWMKLGGGPCLGGGEVPWVYDESTGFAIKYGGCNNGGTTFASGYGNDLSAYDPATERWIALRWVDPCGPPRPHNGCTRYYAYDPSRRVTWFAGGTAGNYLCSTTLGKDGMWVYDGVRDRWDQQPVEGQARFGTGVVGVFDRFRNRFLICPKETWAGDEVVAIDSAALKWMRTGQKTRSIMYTYGCFVDSLKGMMIVDFPGKEGQPSGPARTWLFTADDQWRDLAPGGDELPTRGRPTLAYDPGNELVLCIGLGRTFVYSVRENRWTDAGVETPKANEMLVFDRRHKVFLATAAMGVEVHAFRVK